MKKYSSVLRFGGIVAFLVLLALNGVMTPLSVQGKAASPAESIQIAWQNAQKAGTYHYTTELVQTTYPAPTLSNIGRTAQEDYLYMDGHTDLLNGELLMTLWGSNGSPATGQNGIEIRIKGDEAYGRQTGEDWQKMSNFSGSFAPQQDLLAYLAGAKNAHLVEEADPNLDQYKLTQIAFEVDGPSIGKFVRDQLEQTLTRQGKLPANLTLSVTDQYIDLTGTGSIWLDRDNLPARLVINAEFPQQENGQRIAVSIKTDFSDFGPVKQANAQGYFGSLSLALMMIDWGQTGAFAVALLMFAAVGVLIFNKRQSKLVFVGVTLTTIFAMVVSPLLQSQQVLAFTQDQAAKRAEAQQLNQEAQKQQEIVQSLVTSNWDPFQVPGKTENANANSSVSSESDLINIPLTSPTEQALNSSQAAAPSTVSSLECTSTENTNDKDNDGLTDCQEKNMGTDPNSSDTDSDGLTDGQEVRFLGTNPLLKDSDKDLISDKIEVTGFVLNGKRWYTNPINPDTNRDGLSDGMECLDLTGESPSSSATCPDSDGNGMPDIFDYDNDGDGVSDRIDLSPNRKITGFSSQKPIVLQANSLEPNRDIFVNFQIRPNNPDHLTYAMNVLDWPANDNEGQVIRIKNTTFADSLTTVQAGSNSSFSNGDMRLVPMLEIQMDDDELPLPRTDPKGSSQISSSASGWISATLNFSQVNSQSILTIQHNLANNLDEVAIYTGGCISATQLAMNAKTLFTFAQVSSNSQLTIDDKLLNVLNGTHALTLKQGEQLACLNLGDLPNGKDLDKMIDTTALGFYGISVRDGDKGTVVAYSPLSMVNDVAGEKRQAFSAQMVYRQGSTKWGNAQKIRLVWLIQLLDDNDFTQTIHVYNDDFTLTGLTMREDHGMNVVVAFEDPKNDTNLAINDNLWQVAEGLRGGFISGRTTNDQLDLTLSIFQKRFEDQSNGTDALEKRWAIPGGKIKVLNYSFSNQNGLAAFATGQNQKILSQYFMNNGVPFVTSAAFIFAREEVFRSINLDNQKSRLTDTQITLEMANDAAPLQTLAAFNLSPFRYEKERWQNFPVAQYLDLVSANDKQFFRANPPSFLSPGAVDYEKSLDTMVLVARSNEMTLLNGQVNVVSIGSKVLSDTANIARDVTLAKAVGSATNTMYTVISTLATKAFQALANRSFAMENLVKGDTLTKLALDKITQRVIDYQAAGEQFKGNFANTDAWNYATAGLGVVCLIMNLAAAFSGNAVVQYIALALNLISSLVSVITEIAKYVVSKAVETASKVTDLVKSAADVVGNAASTVAVIGLIISSAVSIGLFIYQIVAGEIDTFSLSFNAALAGLVAQIAVATLMLMISLIPVGGAIITAIIGAIDSLVAIICTATGAADQKNKYIDYLCGGVSGILASVVQYYFYSAVPLITNLNEADRLTFANFKPTLVDINQGFAVGNSVKYVMTITNTIKLTNPLNPPDTIIPNWKSLAYWWQFNEQNLRGSKFNYLLQTSKNEITSTTNSWVSLSDPKQITLRMDKNVDKNVSLPTAGINLPVELYLTEAYDVPTQECWAWFYIPICYIRSDFAINHNDLGASIKWDVFPATLDEFYTPMAIITTTHRVEGYTLAWGQTFSITTDVANTAQLSFPRMKDFDGDGLLNNGDGGIDPNDSKWDTDGDGLSDPYEQSHGINPENSDSDGDGLNDYAEIRLGTDPMRADSDTDGLVDKSEIEGWEIVYGFDSAGVPLKTLVTSNPLMADADTDGVIDNMEKILGTNPNVLSSNMALTYQAQLKNVNAASLLLRFEETSNVTSFADSSGQNRTAVCSGSACPVSGLSGFMGNSVQFDGVNDLIQVSSAPVFKDSSFSVAFWAKRNSIGGVQWIVTQNTSTPSQGLQIGFASDNKFVCGFGASALKSSTAYTDTGWHHWDCTFNTIDKTRTIFLDGTQISIDTVAAGYQGTGELWIGAWQNGKFTGQLDELGIYNAALTPAMVLAVAAGRYVTSDNYVRPGDQLWYTGVVQNQLNNKTAQGLLRTETASPFLTSLLAPSTFVLGPSQSQTINGTFNLSASAPAGPIGVSQIAGGQIIDWREASNKAELWLKMDEPSGGSAFADQSGIQPTRPAVCSGNTCPEGGLTGSLGFSARFDGVADYLTVNNSANLKPNYLSVAGRINASNFSDNGAPIAAKGKGNDAALWSLDFYNSNPRMIIGQYSSSSFACQATDTVLSTSTWYHIAGTFDGKSVVLYVNGKAVKNCTLPSSQILASNDHAVTIGSRQSGSSESYDLNFAGNLDDVRIYDRALTGGEISALSGERVFSQDFEYLLPNTDLSGSKTSCDPNPNRCPSQSQGIKGLGLSFSRDDYLNVVGTNIALNSGPFTQIVWISPTVGTELEGILGYNTGLANGSPSIQRQGKKLVVGFGTSSGWQSIPPTGDVLTYNAWNQVAVTFDGKTTYQVYVNGMLMSSSEVLKNQAPTANNNLWLGRTSNTGSIYVDKIHVIDEHDASPTAEICMSWTSGPNASPTEIWRVDSADANTDYIVDKQLYFTEVGYLRIWEDDSGTYCGPKPDGWDDNIWMNSFTYADLPIYGPKEFTWDYTNDSTGSVWLGKTGGPNAKIGDSIPFSGFLDAVSLYRYAMTAEQITADYQSASVPLLMHLDDPSGAGLSLQGFSNAVDLTNRTNGVCKNSDACPLTGLPGRVGNAAQFDGVDDYIEIPGISGNANSLSVSAWIKPRVWSTSSSGGVILSSATANNGNKGYTLSVGNGGQASFVVSAAGVWCEALSTAVLSLDNWSHLTGAYNGSKASLYINGALAASKDCPGFVPSLTNSLNVGRSPAFPDRMFNGLIDEVQVSNKGLSSNEVLAIYHAAQVLVLHLDDKAGVNSFTNNGSTPNGACSGQACPAAGVNGKLGQAALFDGVNDVIEIPDSQDLKPAVFSVAVWAKANSWAPTYSDGVIVSKANSGVPSGYILSTGGKGQASFRVGVGGVWCEVVSQSVLGLGIWNHLAASYDGTKVSLFINGRLQTPTVCGVGTISHSTKPFTIGQSTINTTGYFNGVMDEVTLYANALSSQEIGNLYALQAKYVEDRFNSQVIVDSKPPYSVIPVTSGINYRQNLPQVLGVNAFDDVSGVAMVELGACKGLGCTLSWSVADACLDAIGSTWCPIFKPSGDGWYTLKARATDRAGLRETPTNLVTIYVDGTPPTILPNNLNGDVLPVRFNPALGTLAVHLTGTVTDPSGIGADAVWATLFNAKGQVVGSGEQKGVVLGDQWSIDYPVDQKVTGTYTFKLAAGDKIGNDNKNKPVKLVVNLDSSAPQVKLNLSSLPITTLPITMTLTGLVTETGNTNGQLFGIQSVETAILPSTPALYNDVQPPAGVVRYFPLDDQPNRNGVLQATDLASGDHGACESNSCPATGIQAYNQSGFAFNGMNDMVDLGSKLDLSNSSFTLAAWARRTVAGTTDMLIGQGLEANGMGLNMGFQADNHFVCGFYGDVLIADSLYSDNAWHHWVCTYDAVGQALQLYRDGIYLVGKASSLNFQASGNLYLGTGTAADSFFDGLLDDVYIFNRALKSSEVYDLYGKVGSGPAQPIKVFDFEQQLAVGGSHYDQNTWSLNTGPLDTENKSNLGKVGSYAFKFDGIDDVVLLNHQSNLNFDNLTVAGWVMPFGSIKDGAPLATKGFGGGGEAWNLDFMGGTLRLSFYKDSTFYSCQSTAPVNPYLWSHVAGTYDGVRIQIYLDGELTNTCSAPAGNLAQNQQLVSIGSRQSGSGSYDLNFSGAIDDVRLYRRAISSAEVKELFYMGWHPAELTAGEIGVLNSGLKITIPGGLEGNYTLALRSLDLGGNFDTSQANAWNGSLDSLAPRASLVRTYPTADSTQYRISAEDFYLDPASLSFSGCSLVTQTYTYQSNWYMALIGNKAPQVTGLDATCTVNGKNTLPVSGEVCDLNGNCTSLSLENSQRTMSSSAVDGVDIPAAPVVDPRLGVVISTPLDQAVFVTTTLPISIEGKLSALDYSRLLTVTVDSAPVLLQNWSLTQTITNTTWTAVLSSTLPGKHNLVVSASDYAGNSVQETSKFYVDPDVPTVTMITTPFDIWYDSSGGVELKGKVQDAGGIASVVVDISGPVNTPNVVALVNGGDWIASWPIPTDAPINAVPYTFTVRATDMAGRVITTVIPDFIVDLTLPTIGISSVKIDDVEVIPGQVITGSTVNATFTFSATDNTPISFIWYAWVTQTIDPENSYPGLITMTNPSLGPITISMPLSVSTEQGAVRRYLYVGATDAWNTYDSKFFGPIYQDPVSTPDYIGMNEPDGPLVGKPYREWMKDGCTLLGTDTRIKDWAQTGSLLKKAQNLYATWDHKNLRLTWTGANWDSSGDLFIYLDTTDGGSYLASNPYPATQNNTILLLPAQSSQSAFFADYAIWVKDSQTAILLKWNNNQSSWDVDQNIPLTTKDGDWGYHFAPEEPGYTDLSLPFSLMGITDPGNTQMGLVAFATEENALRTWAVMPPANHVTSLLVSHLAPKLDEPSEMLMTESYTFNLGDNACQTPRGRLQFEVSASPSGLDFSLTNDDVYLLIKPFNLALFTPFESAYQNWLDTVFCPTYYWFVECRENKALTHFDILGALSTFKQVEFPPVVPGQTITYTIRYQNDSPTHYTDLLAQVIESTNSVSWPGSCNLISLGSIPAYGEGVFVFTGVAKPSGVYKSLIHLLDQVTGFDTDSCTYASANKLTSVETVHIPDKGAPSDVTIQSPRTVIGADFVHVVGSVADASPVPMITLEISGDSTSTQIDCPDPTPGDGQWSCDWDVKSTNGNTRPMEGFIFTVRARATDVFGKVSAWSPPLSLKVDGTAPVLTLADTLQSADLLITGSQPTLNGSLADNNLYNGVEVCDANGNACAPAEKLTSLTSIPASDFVYNDVPDPAIPIPDSTQVDACSVPLVRTFSITDAFIVGNLQVGFDATHTYRGDLKVTLTSPLGTEVVLMGEMDNNRHNLNMLWTDFAWKMIDLDDWLDHQTGAPFYQNARKPLIPLRTFYGEQAQGIWTLTICDMFAHDTGTYLNSRLMFHTDIVPLNTQANWSYNLPDAESLDNQTLTSTIFGVDEAGNRSLLQNLTYKVDNVAPRITTTQTLVISAFSAEIPALKGMMVDGNSANVFVTIQDPHGISTQENAVQTPDGVWEFKLKPGELGVYTLIVNAMDAAGNNSNGGTYTVEVVTPYKFYLPILSHDQSEIQPLAKESDQAAQINPAEFPVPAPSQVIVPASQKCTNGRPDQPFGFGSNSFNWTTPALGCP